MRDQCPDCGVYIGAEHQDGCDVERCPDCGGQMISCDCEDEIVMPRIAWSGEWPGIKECQEFGWYSKMVPKYGWIGCDKEDIGATEDLNRLVIEGKWDREKARFITR